MQIMGIMLYKVVRDGLSDEMTFDQMAEVRAQVSSVLEPSLQPSDEMTFDQMAEVRAQALKILGIRVL